MIGTRSNDIGRSYDLTGIPGKTPMGNYAWMMDDLLSAPVVHTGEWQGMNTTPSPAHATHEMQDVTLVFDPLTKDMDTIMPFIDHSWADDHFLERVSGTPHNPAPSHVDWPYAVRGNADHIAATKFDHTYPERFWPKHAGPDHTGYAFAPDGQVQTVDAHGQGDITDVCGGHKGIRFHYGDLNDVVDLLVQNPLTRQAYLPVWFPEDTGAGLATHASGHRVRVPCTLGYHFMVRDGGLSCRYYLRSCDVYRHLSNDVYFAGMLTRWVAEEVNKRTVQGQDPNVYINTWTPVRPSRLTMYIASLHAFTGDLPTIRARMRGDS